MDENPELLRMAEHKFFYLRPGFMNARKPPYKLGTTYLRISLMYKDTLYHVYAIVPFTFFYVTEPNISCA